MMLYMFLSLKNQNLIICLFCRSTNLDMWSREQLKTMILGGNNRARNFFKQHGWTNGGKVEAKYTSRAAELYRQILSKEVAKSMTDKEIDSPSSPTASQFEQVVEELPRVKTNESPNENASHTTISNTVRKPISAKKTKKAVGLGARKLTRKVYFYLHLYLKKYVVFVG